MEQKKKVFTKRKSVTNNVKQTTLFDVNGKVNIVNTNIDMKTKYYSILSNSLNDLINLIETIDYELDDINIYLDENNGTKKIEDINNFIESLESYKTRIQGNTTEVNSLLIFIEKEYKKQNSNREEWFLELKEEYFEQNTLVVATQTKIDKLISELDSVLEFQNNNNQENIKLKNNLKNVLDEMDLSQTELAKRVGASTTQVSNLINNKTTNVELMLKVANSLGKNFEELFYFFEPMKKNGELKTTNTNKNNFKTEINIKLLSRLNQFEVREDLEKILKEIDHYFHIKETQIVNIEIENR